MATIERTITSAETTVNIRGTARAKARSSGGVPSKAKFFPDKFWSRPGRDFEATSKIQEDLTMVKARNSEDEGTARRDGARTPEVFVYAPLNEIKAGPREMRCSAPEVDESMQETPREAHRPGSGAAHPEERDKLRLYGFKAP